MPVTKLDGTDALLNEFAQQLHGKIKDDMKIGTASESIKSLLSTASFDSTFKTSSTSSHVSHIPNDHGHNKNIDTSLSTSNADQKHQYDILFDKYQSIADKNRMLLAAQLEYEKQLSALKEKISSLSSQLREVEADKERIESRHHHICHDFEEFKSRAGAASACWMRMQYRLKSRETLLTSTASNPTQLTPGFRKHHLGIDSVTNNKRENEIKHCSANKKTTNPQVKTESHMADEKSKNNPNNIVLEPHQQYRKKTGTTSSSTQATRKSPFYRENMPSIDEDAFSESHGKATSATISSGKSMDDFQTINLSSSITHEISSALTQQNQWSVSSWVSRTRSTTSKDVVERNNSAFNSFVFSRIRRKHSLDSSK